MDSLLYIRRMVLFSYFLEMGEVCGQYLSQGYIATLPHMQSKMGQREGFVFDDNAWLVANWWQGVPTSPLIVGAMIISCVSLP